MNTPFLPSFVSRLRAPFRLQVAIALATLAPVVPAATLGWNADALSVALAKSGKLSAAAEGVMDVAFTDFFKFPIGPLGLEFSDKARRLDGQQVRLLGFMVHQDQTQPGLMLLAPFALGTDEAEYGLCDDLPASVVFVTAPRFQKTAVPFTPGPLVLTGRLELGAKTEPDGRVSQVRLNLSDDAAPAVAASAR